MLITEDLIALIERTEAARLKAFATAAKCDVLEVAGGVAAFCGEGNPMTQVAAVGLGHQVSSEEFEAVMSFFRGRATQFEFKLSPLSDRGLREMVLSFAKSIPEFETMLVRDIANYEGPKCEIEIREIGANDAHGFAERMGRWFFPGGESPPGLDEIIAASCLAGGSRNYEVWMDGRPVAGCGLGLSNGLAWQQGAAVEPAYRGRGLHKAMQSFRMRVARDEGYSIIAQGALPGSQSQLNAQKNGFEIAFTRPTFFLAP